MSSTDTVNSDVNTMDTNPDVDTVNLESVKKEMDTVEALTYDMVLLSETQIGDLLGN